MFLQVSPSEQDLSETLSSLNFASRVRGVELGPVKKQVDTAEVQKLKQMVSSLTVYWSGFLSILKPEYAPFSSCIPDELLKLDKAKQDLRSKDDALRRSDENFYNLEGKAKGRDQLCKIQEEKLTELEDQLASKAELCRQLERQLLQLSERMTEKEEICSNFQLKVDYEENLGFYPFMFLILSDHIQSLVFLPQVEELEDRMKEREQTASLTLQRKVFALNEFLTYMFIIIWYILLLTKAWESFIGEKKKSDSEI